MPTVPDAVSLKYWVVLPTYCEAESLPVLLDKLAFSEVYLNILVVDDNSPDGTGDIAARLGIERPEIHLLKRKAKAGLGAAYLDGFKYVIERGADVVITMDSDLSHDPAYIPDLLAAIDSAACVVGSRYVSNGRIIDWPVHRKVLSAVANKFVRNLFAIQIHDCTSGFRAYRRTVIEDILKNRPRSEGYSFQVEALRIAASGPLPVVEKPICFVERVAGRSKMGLREVVMGASRLLSLKLRGGTKK